MIDRSALGDHLCTLIDLLNADAPDDLLRPVCRLLVPLLTAIVVDGDRETDDMVREVINHVFGAPS